LESVTINTQQQLDPARWLESHGDYLYRYALVRVRDVEVAEDLLQETLLAAVGGYRSHAGRSSERTWLVGILKHKVIDYFRRIARNAEFQLLPEGDDDEFEESGPWRGHWREDRAPISWRGYAGQALESREFWETFEGCLARLPRQMSIAFTLREIDGLTSPEICEILSITPNNLWVLLHRGRSKLRQLLEIEWFQKRNPFPPVVCKDSSPAPTNKRLRNLKRRFVKHVEQIEGHITRTDRRRWGRVVRVPSRTAFYQSTSQRTVSHCVSSNE
jgi:RNA polymerase sigma-70 factor (ECF subfamily)